MNGIDVTQAGKAQGFKTMKKFCCRDLEGSEGTISNHPFKSSKRRLSCKDIISKTALITLEEEDDADAIDGDRKVVVKPALKMFDNPEEMKKRIERFSQLGDHDKTDSCVVAISSHGGFECGGNGKTEFGEYIFASDGKRLYRNELLSHFGKEKCPKLYGKPKLFLLDGCRGVQEDYVDYGDGPYRDMCIFSSSRRDYQSYDRDDKGSVFIEAVTDIFANHACDTDFKELRHKVKERMDRIHLKVTVTPGGQTRKVYLIPDWDCFLKKTLYFNPHPCEQRCIDEAGCRCNRCY